MWNFNPEMTRNLKKINQLNFQPPTINSVIWHIFIHKDLIFHQSIPLTYETHLLSKFGQLACKTPALITADLLPATTHAALLSSRLMEVRRRRRRGRRRADGFTRWRRRLGRAGLSSSRDNLVSPSRCSTGVTQWRQCWPEWETKKKNKIVNKMKRNWKSRFACRVTFFLASFFLCINFSLGNLLVLFI